MACELQLYPYIISPLQFGHCMLSSCTSAHCSLPGLPTSWHAIPLNLTIFKLRPSLPMSSQYRSPIPACTCPETLRVHLFNLRLLRAPVHLPPSTAAPRDYVKKVAVYRDRVAVQLPSRVVLYELAAGEGGAPGVTNRGRGRCR